MPSGWADSGSEGVCGLLVGSECGVKVEGWEKCRV